MEYPPYRRLADAAALLPKWKKLKSMMANAYERWMAKTLDLPRPAAPGPFCSDLVVRLYDRLAETHGREVALIRDGRGSRQTSPRDLADPNISALELRRGLIVFEDPTLPDHRDKEDVEFDKTNGEATRAFNERVAESVRRAALVQLEMRKLKAVARRMLDWASKQKIDK